MKIEDWSILMDTMCAVVLAATVLLVVTIVLITTTIIVYRNRIFGG
ncbi:hypothetical protein V7112_15815 [Bacillus sp. JJ1566]